MADRQERIDPDRWLSDHGDAMYRYALLRLGQPDAAVDAVQEALLAALVAKETFRGESQERTWLIGILRYKVLDVLRQRRRTQSERMDELGDESSFKGGTFREEPGDWNSLPAASAERKEFRELLLQCLQSLPDQMRQAICLREIDGLETDEICKILAVTPTNLWTLIHRAKLRLRADITKLWFEKDA